MSWFTDLAGKAESLLNNIDQSAAGAIKNSDTFPSPLNASASSSMIKGKDEEHPKKAMLQSASDASFTKYAVPNPNADPRIPKQPSYSKLDATKMKATTTKDKDAALFDFLNSTDKPSTPRSSKTKGGKGRVKKSVSSTSVASHSNQHPNNSDISERQKTESLNVQKDVENIVPSHASFHISRSSSIDSINSKQTANKTLIESGSSEGNEPSSEADMVSYPMDTASESEFEMVSNTGVSSAVPSERDSGSEENQYPSDQGIVSNLQMQNKLLQNEIAALHQELKSMSERNIRSRSDLEGQLVDMERKTDDLNQQYNVKNSQVQALMMQVNDLQNDNQSLKRNVDSLKTERQRIIGDQTAGSDMHAQAMDQLRLRLEEAESSLIRERDQNQSLREEALSVQERQAEETRKLADSLRKSETEKTAHKKRLDDVTKEINVLQMQLGASQHELSDYKQKATRILQSKERLIASLKGGSEADLTASTTVSIELEELRQERDAIKEELIAARSELMKLRHEFQEVEGQYQQENSILQEELDGMRIDLDGEMRSRREAEKDVAKFEKEIRREREEATRARAAANERLQDKEEEVGKLRSQLMMRSRSSPDESELESRLHQLTETLLQKQTIVETMAAEKSSLVLQLERAEGQIKRLCQENSTRLQIPADVGENAGLHNRSNTGSAMFEFSNGSPHGVVGHVRKAASAVDRFSVRLGVFLRRYPIARLFVIVYMGLLHLWVMIVLLTYSPEIHGADYHHNNVAHDANAVDQPQVDHGLPKDG